MFCEQCGKQIKDGVAFCNFCGAPVRVRAARQVQEVTLPKTKRKKGILIGAAAGLLIGIAAALVIVYVPAIRDRIWGTDFAADDEAENEDLAGAYFSGNIADAGDSAVHGAEIGGNALTDGVQEELEAIDALAAQSEDYFALWEVLQQYADFAETHANPDFVSERVQNVFADYQRKFFEHIELLEGQGVSSGLYLQMNMDFTDALELAARLSELGMSVDTTQIEEKYTVLPQTYKERYISTFAELAEQSRNENGVVSRSVLWSLMEGVDQLEFYERENPEDPLRRCYTAAFALQIDGEMDVLSDLQANIRIYEVMEDADYSPLLIYYLAERSQDAEAMEWRNHVQTVMENHGYDFFSRDIIGMRNFIYEFSMDGSEQAAACRSEIREYMRDYFQNHN
ncbi:MAG: zinc-ribbon domain-containing protein [Lachnospiraceae bacterium]|nr:zinc-ribbon domain-containing protein [Lachnospiraceae bacterium]